MRIIVDVMMKLIKLMKNILYDFSLYKKYIIFILVLIILSCQPEPIQVQVGNGIKELKETQSNQRKMIHEMDSIFAVCDSMLKILENKP